ncbi:MAG: SUMF1/EgtB/PvdO family nonheme iron enzyme, partial [Verrucomicrobia bacterium]|nr:SUMF1/EgtB/PvdO family nonheme iron enzyme [Verrucomicrobiota bacterium]
SASSPYNVKLGNKKQFFCAKASDEPIDPLVPGQDATVFLPGGVALDMIWISPGTFRMGSPEYELGRSDDETRHKVTLTQGYWLGKYEVTQAQYEAVTGENPSRFKGADLPVENVSWNDAMAFCAKLTERDQAASRLPRGYEYILPTEAQWEYACRAGTMTAFNNGTDIEAEEEIYGECPNLDEVAWYWCNSSNKTHPVGQKLPNDWDLYDMHGNVFEWCLDRKSKYPDEAVTDPVGEGTDDYRARRGGSYSYYDDGAKNCRSAARNTGSITMTSNSLGFRVALVHTGIEGTNITIPLSDTVNLEMIWIEPGTFMMGSPEDEVGRWADETLHQVTLTQGYWMSKYMLTWEQYNAITGQTNSGTRTPVGFSRNGALDFCARLTAQEREAGRLPKGYKYYVPTEAQWEYACRAGTTTALNSGKNLSRDTQCPEMDEVGWYWGNCDINGPSSVGLSVGLKKPNAWGLYDMHGYMFEMCLDWYEADYPTEPVTDPTGPSTGQFRVIRGGSTLYHAGRCRSAFRYITQPENGGALRLVLVPVKK